MSIVYFFRHGQAGTRHDYDRLSGVGHEQARLLGRHLAARGVRFDAFYSGELRRQRETAAAVRTAMGAAEPVVDAGWNEFDLDVVYRGIAPQLAVDDEEFRLHYETLQAEIASGADNIHRQWTRADMSMVKAWIMGRYQFEGESWLDFNARIASNREKLLSHGRDEVIGISTSATPIAISVGLALELPERHVLRLAGAMHNSALTILHFRRPDDIGLSVFNATPHLESPELLTYR